MSAVGKIIYRSCVRCTLLTLSIVPIIHATRPIDAGNQWQALHTVEQGLLGTLITPSDVPYAITQPGLYTLSQDISTTSSTNPAITISSSDVTLNLNGHALTSVNSQGIFCADVSNVHIFNGFLATTNQITLLIQNCEQIKISQIGIREYPDVAIQIQECFDVLIEDCDIDFSNGNQADGTVSIATVAIVEESNTIVLNNCEIRSTSPDFVLGYLVEFDCSNIIFRTCTLLSGQSVSAGAYYGFSILASNALLENCTVTGTDSGFSLEGNAIIMRNCTAELCEFTGFENFECNDFTMINCRALECESGFTALSSNRGIISNCSALNCQGGFSVDEGQSVIFDNCTAANCETGFEVSLDSQAGFQNCNAYDCDTGFSLLNLNPFPSKAYLKNCSAIHCNTGLDATLGDGGFVIKDSLFSLNAGRGIDGVNLAILDTRSETPINGVADNTPGAFIVTY